MTVPPAEITRKSPSEMLERRRERIYWYGALTLLVAWPLAFHFLVPSGADGMHWQMPKGFQLFLAFVPGLAGALLLELFVSTLTGGAPRLLRKNVAVSVNHRMSAPLGDCAVGILLRLQQEGFRARGSPDSREIEFSKAKQVAATGFDSHAFSGRTILTPEGAETVIQMTVVFHELVLIETGETARLHELGSRLCGADVAPPGKEVTLLLVTGLAEGMLCALLTLVPWFRTAGIAWLWAFSISSVLLCLLGLAEVVCKRTRLFGVRLGVLGICLGSTPLVAMVWNGML